MKRRVLLGSLLLAVVPAHANRAALQAAILAYTGGKTPRAENVHLEIAALVENGNTVPVKVHVDSAMSAEEHVVGIALFNELNPQRDVVRFSLTPANGKAEVGTRIRLASSQQLVAVALMSDGSCCSQAVDVVVTLAACVE
ncbi:MAG TPA: thiosulfate oxidation carrier protein SoxY [Burkholderiaceae bacterium]|jgi:sulfur-oxidizing protein SoxY